MSKRILVISPASTTGTTRPTHPFGIGSAPAYVAGPAAAPGSAP